MRRLFARGEYEMVFTSSIPLHACHSCAIAFAFAIQKGSWIEILIGTVPTAVSYLCKGVDPVESFARTLAPFVSSVCIMAAVLALLACSHTKPFQRHLR